jgi:hypothetical protein
MHNTKAEIQEQVDINKLSAEAQKILEILDKIEDHTADLRKSLIQELHKSNPQLHIKIED